MRELNFICPTCGYAELVLVTYSGTTTRLISGIIENDDFEFCEEEKAAGFDVLECGSCGYQLSLNINKVASTVAEFQEWQEIYEQQVQDAIDGGLVVLDEKTVWEKP